MRFLWQGKIFSMGFLFLLIMLCVRSPIGNSRELAPTTDQNLNHSLLEEVLKEANPPCQGTPSTEATIESNGMTCKGSLIECSQDGKSCKTFVTNCTRSDGSTFQNTTTCCDAQCPAVSQAAQRMQQIEGAAPFVIDGVKPSTRYFQRRDGDTLKK